MSTTDSTSFKQNPQPSNTTSATMNWYAIEYWNSGVKFGPVLVRTAGMPGRVYWGFGPTSFEMTEDQNPVILKDYGPFKQSGNSPYMQFTRDFPPTSTEDDDPCEGWVSPGGKLYSFEYGGHSDTARRFCVIRRYKITHPVNYEDVLIENGWVCLRHGMTLATAKGQLTRAQAKRINRITAKHPDNAEWKRTIRHLKFGGAK